MENIKKNNLQFKIRKLSYKVKFYYIGKGLGI